MTGGVGLNPEGDGERREVGLTAFELCLLAQVGPTEPSLTSARLTVEVSDA